MIDRINFTKSITHDNVERNISMYFDEIMALYNLLGSRDDLDISANGTPKTIEFIILTDSKDETTRLYNSIEGHEIPIYGHVYRPELRSSKNSVELALIDCVLEPAH